jgi:hypothetical protein
MVTDRRCSRLFRCVRVAAAATVALLLAIFLHTAEGGHTRGFVYTIEQPGGTSQGVIPLRRGTDDVQTFYGYPGGAARSNTGLEQPETSLLFLYEDAQGKVSLVMIHDAPGNTGGAATFAFAGIPEGTTFIVKDDEEDGPYTINLPGGTATVTWEWNDVNTDGGVLSGSLEKQAWTITITPQFPPGGGTPPGQISAWKFLTGSLNDPTEIALDTTDPITIRAIPAALQVVTTARLTAQGQNCQVATGNGPLTANLAVVVEGMLQILGQQIVAPNGNGGLLITFEGEIPPNSTLTFSVSVNGGPPQVVTGVPVEGSFFAVANVSPPNVTFIEGPAIKLSGPGFAFQIAGTTVSTGPWTLSAKDATPLKVMVSPDFPQIGWTAQIEAETNPTLTFANVSACDLLGTGLRHTIVRTGFVDIKPEGFPNPVNPTSKGVVPVAILGTESFDVHTIDAATIEIDDDRVPGGGVAPERQRSFEDVNGDGFLDLSLKFDATALSQAGLLGNKKLYITGAIGAGDAQVLGADTVCVPEKCVP